MDSYEKKVNSSIWYRVIILVVCIGVVIAFACALRYFAIRVANWENELQISNLVAFVTACISFVSLIIGLLTIITKYFFPENDEQYITQLLKVSRKTIWKTNEKMQNNSSNYLKITIQYLKKNKSYLPYNDMRTGSFSVPTCNRKWTLPKLKIKVQTNAQLTKPRHYAKSCNGNVTIANAWKWTLPFESPQPYNKSSCYPLSFGFNINILLFFFNFLV